MRPLPRYIYTKVSQVSVLLPIIAGVANYKRLTRPFRIFLYFFIACVLFEIQAEICDAVFKNNMPGLHLYVLVELFAFSALYYFHFEKKGLMRSLVVVAAVIGFIMSIAGVYVDGILKHPDLARSYSAFCISLYSLAGFYKMFRQDIDQYSWKYPMFWVNIGALLYFTGQAFYFPMINHLLKTDAQIETYSLFANQIFNIIAYCLYAQSFRCFKESTRA